jgi:class 3 adenylate cyclase
MTEILIEHEGTLDKYMGDAIMCFWGPVTDTWAGVLRAPLRGGARACTYPFSIEISAPSLARPLRCWSMGRIPMAQPPGRATRATPCRATRGPSTSTDARMVDTSS